MACDAAYESAIAQGQSADDGLERAAVFANLSDRYGSHKYSAACGALDDVWYGRGEGAVLEVGEGPRETDSTL
jgi:hypothetical protein